MTEIKGVAIKHDRTSVWNDYGDESGFAIENTYYFTLSYGRHYISIEVEDNDFYASSGKTQNTIISKAYLYIDGEGHLIGCNESFIDAAVNSIIQSWESARCLNSVELLVSYSAVESLLQMAFSRLIEVLANC
ncbi:TPA: hypothetical protein I8273_004438 [Aeromonas hydrophila]|nr:hypothetical protein [Aeromonas hydrophila]HAT2638903.1 hypothetical protein [Aeromonas hydrophila]HAT3424003.1 hypothetical protein [Aeromonas hydrophila]HAT3534039.1 hypothetical protein [Aeromonas hydrophila]